LTARALIRKSPPVSGVKAGAGYASRRNWSAGHAVRAARGGVRLAW
jgi:hypothetical protein